jgi:hypothetical protein
MIFNLLSLLKNRSRLIRSSCSASVCIPLVVARLSKRVSAATNTNATIEELDASFSMQCVSYQRKVGD